MKISLLVPDTYQGQVYPEIKKVIIKRNYTYGYYSLFVGNTKVWQEHYKADMIDRIKDVYPNAQVIDKTI